MIASLISFFKKQEIVRKHQHGAIREVDQRRFFEERESSASFYVGKPSLTLTQPSILDFAEIVLDTIRFKANIADFYNVSCARNNVRLT